MYALSVRDHMMIAHSFTGEVFGPAQGLHGATYVVDAEFRVSGLDADGLVVDIGLAAEALKAVLARYNYKNLDELDELAGANTTTEYMAHRVFLHMKSAIAAGDLGPGAARIESMKVTLHESHTAWAAYEGPLD
ncbi:MAG: 6-carboxytetrahydropterin synthase [Alphaproteobacteria bacterium]|nr:6-carboxytetrahydropterin synthase [Alphaproteobacteria bacterium]